MATTYVKGRGKRKGYTTQKTVKDIINYSADKTKTENFRYVTANDMGLSLDINSQFDVTLFINAINRHHFIYEVMNNRKVDEYTNSNTKPFVMMTIRQSFLTGECSAEVAHEVGNELAKRVLGDDFQYMVCTHTNTDTVHNHIEFNPVSKDFKKYKKLKFEYLKIQKISDEICEEFGLSTVIKSNQKRSKIYSKNKGYSFRKILKIDIDNTIKTVNSYEEFIEKMRESYFVNTNGKYITFKHKTNGQQRNIRAYTLGESYTEEMLRFRCIKDKIPVLKRRRRYRLRFLDRVFFRYKNIQKTSYNNYLKSKKNIFTLAKTINIVVENKIKSYDDINKIIERLSDNCNLLLDKLDKLDDKNKMIDKTIINVHIYNEYKQLNKEYQNSTLKKTFYKEHKDKLDKFNEACLFLCENKIKLDDKHLDYKYYTAELFDIDKKKERINKKLNEIKKDIHLMIDTKKTIDALYCFKDDNKSVEKVNYRKKNIER